MEEFSLQTMEAVCLGSSVAFTCLFYYIYRKKSKTFQKLRDAPQLPLDQTLVDLLNATPGKCLQYVVIEGTVQPIGQPIISQFQKDSAGVIQKLLLREHKLVWNSLAHTWSDSERTLQQDVNAVPFSVASASQVCVRVLCPLEATGPKMEVTHEKFHQASYGFTALIGQYLSGEKPKGHMETEEMLKVGASLTAIGELVLDADRLLKLRPPSDGSEYFLSTGDLETLLLEQKSLAEGWRLLACVCALAGGAVLLWAVRRRFLRLQLRWERERRKREFDAMEAPEEDEKLCVICLTNPKACVLLDCGHVCCCFRCYQALPRPNCPVCRRDITRVVPLFQS